VKEAAGLLNCYKLDINDPKVQKVFHDFDGQFDIKQKRAIFTISSYEKQHRSPGMGQEGKREEYGST